MRESLSTSTSLPMGPPLSGVGSSGQMCPIRFQSDLAVPHRPDPGVRTGTRNPWSRSSPWAGSWAATMDNHSPASGKEADDHAIHKFMKDVERRCERHTEIMPLVGEFMKDAINKMKKE